MDRARQFLRLSGYCFGMTVLGCVLLRPGDVLSHDGLSFYGNFRQTFPLYALGLGATAYFLLRAAGALAGGWQVWRFCRGLEAIAVALLGIIVTPSFSGVWLVQDLHVLFGLAIFVTQALLSLGYLRAAPGDGWQRLLLGLQLLAIVLVSLSFRTVGLLDLMLPAQVLAIAAFGGLLRRAVTVAPRLPALKSVSEVTSVTEL